MATIRAEFRKLLSVRSTYIVTGLVALVVAFIAFYPNGIKVSAGDLLNPSLLALDVTGALNICVFGGIVAILLMTHEYRYNTIMYTLTASRSRSKVLLAKIITISAYALLLAVMVAVLSPLFAYLGIKVHGGTLSPQTFHIWSLAWRTLYYGWAYGMAGLVIAVLVRSQVGAIAALLLIPGLVEGLLTELLKKNAVYLPFSALNTLTRPDNFGGGSLSPITAVVVFLLYLVVAWFVAWVLFLRRDAN